MLFLFVLYGLVSYVLTASSDITCTTTFCLEYIDITGCPDVAEACLVQNSTLNGILMPSPITCSCCETCLEQQHLNEFCSIGGPGIGIPPSLCGPGLYCTASDAVDHPTCQHMTDTECFKKLHEYDNLQSTGSLTSHMARPICDADGNFHPVHCIPNQICYCVDEDGERIFGEALHTPLNEFIMKCMCSRMATRGKKYLGKSYPTLFARCTTDGSYDPLQCVDENCVCVNSENGAIESEIYNLTKGVYELDCFDRNIHKNTVYLTDCEYEALNILYKINELKTMGIIIDEVPDICEFDGYYKRIQVKDGIKFCADKNGKQIENYEALIGSTDAEIMNCHCARTERLLEENGIAVESICCPNGDYPKYTCTGGKCYCLDINGNQSTESVDEEDASTLPCYEEFMC